MMKGCSTIFFTTLQRKLQRRLLLAARQRHHHRRHGEVDDVLEAEDQRHRHRRLRPEDQQRQAGSHIADVAIGGGEALIVDSRDVPAGKQHASPRT